MTRSLSDLAVNSPADPGLAALVDELTDRLQAGEAVDLEAFLAQHAEQAGPLRRLLPALAIMGELKQSAAKDAASPEPSGLDPRLEVGVLGDFRIVREIGRGGMGVVYEAQQLSLDRRVALKVLPMAAALDGRQLQRFQLEAHAAACLHHTNIVPVHAVGCERGVPFYAMQFIESRSLAQLIAELRRLEGLDQANPPAADLADISTSTLAANLVSGRITGGTLRLPDRDATASQQAQGDEAGPAAPDPSPEPGTPRPQRGREPSSGSSTRSREYIRTVAELGVQVAEALDHAHTRGILHRDIKPANLLLDDQGQLWVTDFGLAHIQGCPGLTMTGDILGTLRYMSPEQALAKRVVIDGRTDVYSLGVTLYELLTLRPAIDGQDRQEILRRIAQEDPVPPRRLNPAIPRDLETILLKAVSKEPGGRYATARELADELRRFLEGKPIQARQVGSWQRFVLWARRRPAEAGLAVAGSLAALALIGTAVSFWYQAQLKEQKDLVSKERDSARKFQYFQHMALANTAWHDGNMGRLEQLLDDCPLEHQDHWEWRYLKRQCHRESLRLVGHSGAIFEARFSRDGKRMASSGLDNTARMWDTATGRTLQTFRGHDNAVVGVAFNPKNETQVATTGWDGTIRVWGATTGREVRRLDCGLMLWDVAYSPDGERIAAAGSDGTVRVWDLRTGALAKWTGGHAAAPFGVRKVCFSPDGKRLASTGAGGKVNLWDAASGQVIFPLTGHGDLVIGVAFSPDGAHLATASFDRTVRVWDVATGQPAGAGILRGHDGAVWGVAFSPDGEWLASSSADPSVKLWDWKSGEQLRTLRCHGGAVHDVVFSPDGTRLATAGHDMLIKFWDLAELPEARILSGHTGPVNGVAFHPAGRIVASAGQDKTVKLWDVETGRAVTFAGGHNAAILCVAFKPGGQTVASGDKQGVVRLWETGTGRMSQALPDDHGGEVAALAFRPDGRYLAAAGKDGAVRVWEVKTLRKVRTDKGHLRAVTSLAYSPDGTYLASGSEDRQVIVRDPTGHVAFSNEDHTCFVHSVAYSPDGRYFSTARGPGPRDPVQDLLVSVGGDGTVVVWDKTTNQKLPIKAHAADVWSVAFSPDGTRLASASIDRTVKVWDAATGDEVLSLRGHTGGVLGVAFSPDGNLLASAGRDGTVRIWDASPWPRLSPGRVTAFGDARGTQQ
jgi:WD40 repeat protein/serine/threonine protein kinase